jgi:hypothetical protein
MHQLESRKQYLAAVLPVDATSLVITWNLIEVDDPEDPIKILTRYIISVECIKGRDIVPIVKFRVPVTCVSRNDCEQVEKSQDMGTTQPFRVKLCAGDALLVSLTHILAGDCGPVVCGVRDPAPEPKFPTTVNEAFFNLFAF